MIADNQVLSAPFNGALKRKRKRVPGSTRDIAKKRRISKSTAHRRIVRQRMKPAETTPENLAAALFESFDWFELDPAAPVIGAADDMHIKARHRFTNTHGDNGLLLAWNFVSVYCNPPWGRGQLRKWLKKIMDEWEAGHMQQLVVLLRFGASSAGYRRIKASGCVILDIGQVAFGGYKKATDWSNCFCLWGVDESQVARFVAALKRHGVKHVERAQ